MPRLIPTVSLPNTDAAALLALVHEEMATFTVWLYGQSFAIH